jgi:hypothetical protein
MMRNWVVTPGTDETSIAPPWAWMIFLQMGSPSPVPDGSVVKNGMKIF